MTSNSDTNRTLNNNADSLEKAIQKAKENGQQHLEVEIAELIKIFNKMDENNKKDYFEEIEYAQMMLQLLFFRTIETKLKISINSFSNSHGFM
ncbi:hypothetical protein QV06_09380 [Gallibacterium genomosp. 3]|uniref:Uncharacterized protein n=1 Tax=Gallibacterium genomosp. 3 TaxID=505345 RepID=A0A1A7PMS5_9PAST|nr:hypothetical protein [Gallibacterium genomosp. 3]OBX03848.1 hypothetical protein QV06_09380 [Gallibacterium genomosp. 3]